MKAEILEYLRGFVVLCVLVFVVFVKFIHGSNHIEAFFLHRQAYSTCTHGMLGRAVPELQSGNTDCCPAVPIQSESRGQ